MKRIETAQGIVTVTVCHTESSARLFQGDKEWIVMGNVGEYWLCKPRDAARLEKMGYEIL